MVNRISHIDGLRAISIMAVVLFHAFPLLFPSGYLGVDYFLVISGYVISRKYFFACTSEFSILDFWRRRIKRLYPQLLACILLSMPFAFTLMQPDYLENFSQSVIATIFGVNNILLYITGGYWTIANEMKPLFMTWSLGLEEQFYLFSTILIAILGLKSRRILISFAIITITSLLICQYASAAYPRENFLLLPFRLWEFAIGVFAAYLSSKSYKVLPFVANLSLLVVLIFLIFPATSIKVSPNVLLAIPLISTAIVCLADKTNFATRLLAIKPVTYIGLSSYSIYLYHQPLLAYARIISYQEISNAISAVIVVISFVFGIVMYEFIEKEKYKCLFPSKFQDLLSRPRNLLVSSYSLACLNVPVLLNNGFFELRFPHLLIDGIPPKGFLGGKGYTDEPYKYKDKEFKYSTNEDKPLFINVFLIGNSQIRDLINTLEFIEKQTDIDFRYSYRDNALKTGDYDLLLKQANLIVIQGDYLPLSLPREKIPDYLQSYRDKIMLYNNRERFVYNINPVLFVRGNQRFNLKVSSHAHSDCGPNDTFLTDSAYGLPLINSQCAFNSKFRTKLLTDNQGRILTFDGVHLSEAGAKYFADILLRDRNFLNDIKSRKAQYLLGPDK